MRQQRDRALAGIVVGLLGGSLAVGQTELLPDLVTRASDLEDNEITFEGGLKLLRLSNGTANVGDGPLYIYGIDAEPGASVQPVLQRIYRDDGSSREFVANDFVYHPGHNHIHVENWAQFSLREILPGDGIGDIVAQGAKTSFCIIDLEVHDNTLPNFAVRSEFNSCGSIIQGLSVGWIDIYGKYLDGQWIDITNVPPGEYWLESVVDPDDHFVESDETNNAAYVKVTIPSGDSDALEADGYEPNQSLSEAMSYPEGGPKSPNLGPCGPERVVEELSIHAPGEDDYFRFYLPEVGGPNDFVRIDFDHSDGDLDLELFNDVGSFLDSSDSVSDFEEISLAGRSAGWYGVRVFGWNGATNPSYDLTVNPSANDAPTITLLTPPPGDTRRRHGQETYTVDWLAADAEGNDTWVTVYVNESPTFDGKEVLLPTSLHTPGWMGFHIVNSAYFFPGTYYVYASITDGGSFSGAWSDGTITFFDDTFACIADQAEPFGVLNYYDVVGYFDLVAVNDQIADIVDPLGELDFNDVLAMLGVLEAGCGF